MEVKREQEDFHEKSVKIKQEPEFVEAADDIDNIREVKASDYFVSNSDLVNIKRELSELVDSKPELLTTHCDLPSLKSENDHFNEPCSSKQGQEMLKRTKEKKRASGKVIKKKKKKCTCPVCQKSGTCKEKCNDLTTVSHPVLQTSVPPANKKIYLANIKFILPYIMKNITSSQSGKIPIIMQEWQGESTDKNNEAVDTSTVRLESYSSTNSELQVAQNWDDKIETESLVQLEFNKSYRARGSKRKQLLDESDRSAILYKRIKPVADDFRKMFLISLLDEVNEMSFEQMKSFKRRVLLLIDEIMSPTLQSNLQQQSLPMSQLAISCTANVFSNI